MADFTKRQHNLKRFALGLALLMSLGAATVVYAGFQQAKLIAKESAQLALCRELGPLLEQHRQQHGRYPESLHELPVTYPDGGDSKLLDEIEYRTDGEHYRFRVQRASTKEWLEACGPKTTQD